MTRRLNYVNLGCGARYHPDWINLDLVPAGPQVTACDLSRGIPLPDASCGVVYHSHVLEHIRRPEVMAFMRECHRVLKPGGIVRVAVPDLERICRLYLEKMELAIAGDAAAAQDYKWMMLELYDQTVREHWRSEMWHYLNSGPVPNEAFVRQRIGCRPSPVAAQPAAGVMKKISGAARRLVERLLWIKPVRAWAIGRFRLSGEIHQWMYDRYSLAELLRASGFVNPVLQTATQSLIPDWTQFNLDTQPDGTVYKPDSLYMEAQRPTL